MYPVLLQWGRISLYTYGLMIALGFLSGVYLAAREARKVGLNPDHMVDLGFYILLSAIIGSRIFYVLTTPSVFLANPLEIVKIWKGGLVFYGGFIAALATALWYTKKREMPIWKTADVVAPSIAFGQFLGRIGCFFAGCCYGKACDLPWAVTFHHPASLAPVGISLHPAQLYSAGSNLLIFLFLCGLRRKTTQSGQVFWTYVLLYGITRSIVEQFRGDFRGPQILGLLSVSQTIGGIMAIGAVAFLIFGHYRESGDAMENKTQRPSGRRRRKHI